MAVTYAEAEITEALMALIAWAGNAAAATRSLKAKGSRAPSPETLTGWSRDLHRHRYDELREKYAAQIEAQLIGDMRELAGQALEAQRMAVEKAKIRLQAGEDQDPGRTAANLARVASTMSEKMLSLSGRPTQITESRNVGEILRSLVARGVLSLPEETTAVEEQSK